MEEILNNEELVVKLNDIADNYEDFNASDFQGCLMALETVYKIHYQDLFNYVAKRIAEKKIEEMKDKTMDYSSRVEFMKELEKEFDLIIDYIDYSISFKYN